MNIIVADDEHLALQALTSVVEQALPGERIHAFQKTTELMAFASNNACDIAFLDIEMYGMNGIQTALMLKEFNSRINIIFVTGYSQYMGDAFSLHASGYILKPATVEAVRRELQNLRHPKTPGGQGIIAQTFGTFELFVDGKPLGFARTKSKEILAYLIDRRGAGATNKQLAQILWPNMEYTRAKQKQIQTLICEMLRSLKAANAQRMIVKSHNSLAVDPDQFACDYYQFLRMDPAAINAYTGEYMSNYGWAEFTTDALEAKK